MEGWLSCAPFEDLLHLKIEKAAGVQAVLSMPFLYQFSQGAGFLHGGALTSLADTAVAIACKSLLPVGTHFATLSLESTFLTPVQEGIVTAYAVISKSKNDKYLLHGGATVKNQNGRDIMRFILTFKIARKQYGKQDT